MSTIIAGVDPAVARQKPKVTPSVSPGKFKSIKKSVLKIDHAYQRDEITGRVQEMARKWDWPSCGCLIIADRDGEYFVMDGQQRHAAAMRRPDITDMPCFVFLTDGRRDEAGKFLLINTFRKPVTSTQKFGAQVEAGEPEARLVLKLLKDVGRQATGGNGPGSMRSIACMMRWAARNPAVLQTVFPICHGLCSATGIPLRLLDGLCYLESKLIDGTTINNKPILEKLNRIGPIKLDNKARDASYQLGKGGRKVWGEAMLREINKGMSANRLRVDGSEDD